MLDAMKCLEDGVPLSLVLDLISSEGPDAHQIYLDEPADLAWTVAPPAAPVK